MHPRACQLDLAGKRGLPRTDESIRHTAPSLILLADRCSPAYAANHPLTYLEVLLILSARSSLILAASALIKGSSQVVDAQKLTASLNTDKSRFLTLCYALATILDVSRDLMQPHFDRVLHPKNRTLSPPFYHVRSRKCGGEKFYSVYSRLSPA